MFEISRSLLKIFKKILKSYYTYVFLLLLLPTYFTLTPFLKNTFQTPPNKIYLGTENNYDTYFKYLKITNIGQNLSISDLKTKVGQSPLDEKFYLINGKICAVLALSQFSSYHLYRLLFNTLFFVFLYLILSHIFTFRPLRLALFSFLTLILIPIAVNLYSYPHIAFIRLLIIIFIFVFLKLLKLPKLPNRLSLPKTVAIIIFSLLLGFLINSRTAPVPINNSSYLSKDFYEGIGYLRDNALPNEKIICLNTCATLSEVFTSTSAVTGTREDLAYKISTIWDNIEAQKQFQKENAVYWFFGPEEKQLINPDFGRLNPKEVFKNKEVTIYRLELNIL